MRKHPPARVSTTFSFVTRPTKFEHNRYVGDKRSQVVYDLDLADEQDRVRADLAPAADALADRHAAGRGQTSDDDEREEPHSWASRRLASPSWRV